MLTFPAASVLVPLDMSPRSLAALDQAAALVSDPFELHVMVVLAELPPHELGNLWGTIDDASRVAAVRRVVDSALAERQLSDARVEVSVKTGNPARAIARYAADHQIALVVLTSHGRTGLGHLALGSVAERVVRLATCPVLVLKEAAAP